MSSVLQDHRRSNFTVDGILTARHTRTQSLDTGTLVVRESLILSDGAQFSGNIVLNTLSATILNLTASTIHANDISTQMLHLLASSNQATFGPSNEVTLDVDTSIARTLTVPATGSAQFVLTEGAQLINGVKTFSDTVVFLAGFSLASLTLSAVANQLTLGTGNQIVLTAPTPVATRTYTIPEVGAPADFVMTEGNQTINGVKTFTSSFALSSLSLSDVTNQLLLGTGDIITVNAPTPAASRVYTMPDVGNNADFVMTDGNQTINGVKTFTSPFTLTSLALTDTSNQLSLGTGNLVVWNAPTPAALRIYTTPDVGANADFVMTEGNQTINGVKTFTSGFALTMITLSDTTNQIILGSVTTITLTAPTPAASRFYTIPDVLANAEFVMTEGNQTINGVKTFTSPLAFSTLTLTAVSNQLTLGAGNVIVINGPTPAASRTYSLPDSGANAAFVMTAGAQTVGGAKTFSTAVTINPTSNQLVLGAGDTITVTAPTPAAPRTYTMPDVLANADFVMTEGNQTINGVKTFSTAPVFPGLSFASLTLTDVTNQLTVGTGNVTVMTWDAPAASRVYSVQDVGANAAFVMDRGNQTINGTKTFNNAIVINVNSTQLVMGGATTITLNAATPVVNRLYTMQDVGLDAAFIMSQGAQLVAGTKTFSSGIVINLTSNQLILGSGNTTTLNADVPIASRTYTIPDVLANASFVMTEGNQTINGTKTFSTAPVFPALSFASLTLTNTTNQLVLGTTNTTTLTSPTPIASRVYTISDVGANASFVMTAGNQTMTGLKQFNESCTMAASSGGLIVLRTAGVGNFININMAVVGANRTYTVPEAGGAADFVMTAGTQTIGGAKTFSSAMTVNPTTNQIVLGVTNTTTINSTAPAASRTYTIPDAGTNTSFVMGAGNQTIAGDKTFSGNILLATSGGTAANFNYYETYSSTIQFDGDFKLNPIPTCNILITRVGNVCTMRIEGFSSDTTVSAVDTLDSLTAIPAAFRPSVQIEINGLTVIENSINQQGLIRVLTSGTLQFLRGTVSGGILVPTGFNGAGANVGFLTFSISWLV